MKPAKETLSSWMSTLRLVIEILLAPMVVAIQVVLLFWFFTVWPWTLAGLLFGHVFSFVAFRWLAARRARLLFSLRTAFDCWLIGFSAACFATLELVLLRWPIRGRGWDAHGMGMTGGEYNLAFLGPLHVAMWLVLLALIVRLRKRRMRQSSSSVSGQQGLDTNHELSHE